MEGTPIETLTTAVLARTAPASLRLAKLRQSRAYDLVMRVPLLGWSMFCATVQIAGLSQHMHNPHMVLPPTAYAIKLAMLLSTIGFLLLLAAAVVIRTRPTAKAHGLEPRISAFSGTFRSTPFRSSHAASCLWRRRWSRPY